METNDIILSIIVPTYNQEKYIEKAIYSILEQKIDMVINLINYKK